jgi:hypothetical protein
LSGLIHHFVRADFGTLEWTAGGETIGSPSSVWLFFTQTASHGLLAPMAIALLGFGRVYLRRAVEPSSNRPRVDGHDALALFATWLLAGPVLAAFLNGPAEPLAATLAERFRLLPEVVLSIAFAWGLDTWAAVREGRALPRAFMASAIVVVAVFHSWPRVRAAHADVLELYTENTERSAPRGAVIFGTGDYRLFSFLYMASTHARPDVTYIDPHLLGYDWYRRRASTELGAPISASVGEPSRDAIALVEAALSLGRPVLLTDVFEPSLVSAFPSYPIGTLVRLLPRGAPTPTPEKVEQENVTVFADFRRWRSAGDEWADAVLPAYGRPWVALARVFERRGEPARARANWERGKEWGWMKED